jgi:hypothetical protein
VSLVSGTGQTKETRALCVSAVNPIVGFHPISLSFSNRPSHKYPEAIPIIFQKLRATNNRPSYPCNISRPKDRVATKKTETRSLGNPTKVPKDDSPFRRLFHLGPLPPTTLPASNLSLPNHLQQHPLHVHRLPAHPPPPLPHPPRLPIHSRIRLPLHHLQQNPLQHLPQPARHLLSHRGPRFLSAVRRASRHTPENPQP